MNNPVLILARLLFGDDVTLDVRSTGIHGGVECFVAFVLRGDFFILNTASLPGRKEACRALIRDLTNLGEEKAAHLYVAIESSQGVSW